MVHGAHIPIYFWDNHSKLTEWTGNNWLWAANYGHRDDSFYCSSKQEKLIYKKHWNLKWVLSPWCSEGASTQLSDANWCG